MAQTSYLGTTINKVVNSVDGLLIFDATTNEHAPACGIRFQLNPGSTETCYIHIEGLHDQPSATQSTWQKAVVADGIPLDVVVRHASRQDGKIYKVYAWSASGTGSLCWTPIVQLY